jgi:YebC/PmpR family DNA-binding regulatory protein
MAGHSKWANIKHRKAAADAVKGKIFSKIAREISVAARSGGADPGANITLRAIIQKARSFNMPTDNIERAIKRGTGEAGGAAPEEILYEGFAPGGISIVAQALSDNRNRTSSEVRHVFTKFGGNLAAQGSVMRSFRRRGQILVRADAVTEDRLLEIALDAGAEDVARDGEFFEILTEPQQFGVVSDKLAAEGIAVDSSQITLIPDTYVPVREKDQAGQLVKFVEALEDLDDVQNVYSNFDIDESVMESLV